MCGRIGELNPLNRRQMTNLSTFRLFRLLVLLLKIEIPIDYEKHFKRNEFRMFVVRGEICVHCTMYTHVHTDADKRKSKRFQTLVELVCCLY